MSEGSEVVTVNEGQIASTTVAEDGGRAGPGAPERAPAPMPAPPRTVARPSGWTGGRITALVIGIVLALVSAGMLCAGTVALWADRTQRDAAGFVETGVHGFSTAGSALATESIELGSPGVGWLYSQIVLGEVRIRVTPTGSGPDVFVGIGPTREVARYLAGVGHSHIADFWSGEATIVNGGDPASAPGTQDFWAASATGTGVQTLRWDPSNGSWTVVVMNADGSPGIDVRADLGATMPALPWIAFVALVLGAIVAVGATVLIVGALRRVRGDRARAV